MRAVHLRILIGLAVSASVGAAAFAASRAEPIATVEQSPSRPAEAIQDNSFLIEEAYNQEAGVVQHILNIVHTASRRSGADEDQWSFVFTQEWPFFSQTHQLSYTLPYTFLDDGDGSRDGIEDTA